MGVDVWMCAGERRKVCREYEGTPIEERERKELGAEIDSLANGGKIVYS